MVTMNATDGLSAAASQMKRGWCYPDPFWIDSFEHLRRWGFPCGSVGKESACNVGDLGLIPGLGLCPGEWDLKNTPVFWPGEFHGLYKSMGSKRVGHDWVNFTSLHFIQDIDCLMIAHKYVFAFGIKKVSGMFNCFQSYFLQKRNWSWQVN